VKRLFEKSLPLKVLQKPPLVEFESLDEVILKKAPSLRRAKSRL
jgi:hypothetical protein